MVQRVIIIGFTAFFYYEQNSKKFIQQNPKLVVIYVIKSIILSFVVFCYSDTARKTPVNYIFLIVFTFIEGFLLGIISAYFNTILFLLAVGVTAVVCLTLTIFTFQTKWNFTARGGTLLVLLVILLLFGIFWYFSFFHNHWLYAWLGAKLFSFYLVYKIQIMTSDNEKNTLSPDEYIFATLNLYLGIIDLFLFCLRDFNCC
ncbi:hypothetical protein ABEB36_000821 [Hypothenemus hampei]|uniref:Uncharacterized protein n=1 Tax=Hypothenemus hampei TaxID=57062 RepID=A0ABD1FEF1_HYPHA